MDCDLIIFPIGVSIFLWQRLDPLSCSCSATYFQPKHLQQPLSVHIFLRVCVICCMMLELDSEPLLGTSELLLTHLPLAAALRGLSQAE